MKKSLLAFAAIALVLSAAPAMACVDPDCPHGGGKPPKAQAK